MTAHLRGFWKNDEGQGLLEYGLLVALIALVCVVSLTNAGQSLATIWGKLETQLAAAAK